MEDKEDGSTIEQCACEDLMCTYRHEQQGMCLKCEKQMAPYRNRATQAAWFPYK